MAITQERAPKEVDPALIFDGLVGEAWTHNLLMAKKYHDMRPLALSVWQYLTPIEQAPLAARPERVRFKFEVIRNAKRELGIPAGSDVLQATFYIDDLDSAEAVSPAGVPLQVNMQPLNISQGGVDTVEDFMRDLEVEDKEFKWNFKQPDIRALLSPEEAAYLDSIEASIDNYLFREPADLILFRNE